jgi:multicomponent Na+:H+ antiporter subunit D
MAIAPLAVAVPLLTAALLVGAGRRMPRPVADLVALAAAVTTLALCAVLLARVWHGTQVAWMGGWHPRHHGTVAIGISLAVDPLGAGAATFAATLVVAALVYSRRYLQAVAPMYHGLMLVFLGGMVGFCITGDLFNMFVFFELMGVPAYALTAYRVEEPGPLQGALSFAITNSIGGFMLLTGIALLYGRTGALNLAQLGQALAGHRADGLVIAATAFVLCGLLIKAAAVPFHFWLPDAHAVAPVPVCVLLSGIMVPLGLLGLARVYWTVLSGVPGLAGQRLGDVLLWSGAVTAVVGAVMCFLQHHLKRLLAFSTVSHTGLFLVGLATFGPHGLGAVTVFVLAHGATKAALFMAVGILGHRLGTVSERDLHGRGRGRWAAGAVVALGGLALASLPPLAPFSGKALVEEAAAGRGWSFVPALFVLVSALTGGAILRFGTRVFLGVGRPAPAVPGPTREEAQESEAEMARDNGRSPALLVAPMVVLLLAGLCIGAVPEVRHGIDRAAALFADRPAYVAAVLRDRAAPVPHTAPASGPYGSSYAYALASVAGALAGAGAALFARWPRSRRGLQAVVDALHGWHSGHVGDDATWAVVGIVVLGWSLAVVVR